MPPTHTSPRSLLRALALAATLAGGSLGLAQVGAIAPKFLLDPASPQAPSQLSPSSAQVTTATGKDGVTVTIAPGSEDYPGIAIASETGSPWDLAAWGRIEAKITNLGTAGLGVNMRVDNKKDGSSCNAESIYLKPGDTKTLKVIFGYGYGFKPGYKLNPASIVQLLIFTSGKKDAPRSFRIEDLQAIGSAGEKPPVDPGSLRVKPLHGVLLGAPATLDPAKQLLAKGGAQASLTPAGALQVTFTGNPKGGESVTLKPSVGSWDLTDAAQVRVTLKNTGATPATPTLRLESKDGPTDPVTPAPIAPGATAEIILPFAALHPAVIPAAPRQEVYGPGSWNENNWAPQPGTGTKFASNWTKALVITTGKIPAPQTLLVTSVLADAPPADLPAWLGKRPPVDGAWTQTLDENFNGDTLDLHRWNIYAPNYWDKRTHFAKDNAILKNGLLTLHYEKKPGYHNDDPKAKQTDYACGFADTYGKWRQRYGYFEARMKLPKAPGLWPAFWLMPDRGPAAGPQWARSDTKKGGMEFDILEFLSGWGPNRYNIAFHWDGYAKEHKAAGSTNNYVRPDKDGYITAGLYWAPGLAICYAQGQEIIRWSGPRVSTVPSYIMFDMVSGGWDNLPLDDAKLPDDFVIDYVRVWQRADLASPADGPLPNPGLPSSMDAPK